MTKKLTVTAAVRQKSVRNVRLWTRMTWTQRSWFRKRRLLSIGIKGFDGTRGHREFAVIAVEGPNTKTTDVMTAAEEMMGDHKHKQLGPFTSEQAAMQASEEFAKQWLLGCSMHRCSCLPPRKAKNP